MQPRAIPADRPYVPREPGDSLIARLLDEHLDDFLEGVHQGDPDWRVPAFVERELRAITTCGDYTQDFVFLKCGTCRGDGHDAEAIRLLEGASTGADRGRVLGLLGDAYRLQGRAGDAERSHRAALAAGGGLLGVRADLARLLERELGRPEAAESVWREALASGQAARALAELAGLAVRADRAEEARRLLGRLLTEHPTSHEAGAAWLELGRLMLAASLWDEAAAHFGGALASASAARAEAAYVGLMRARLGQGRAADVRELATRYATRFPSGARRSEVQRLLKASP